MIAYNTTSVRNLAVIKEAKRWFNHGFIDEGQFKSIAEAYKSDLYHPNFIVRVLLFIATLIGLSGVTGIVALFVIEISESLISLGCIAYGIISFLALDKAFIGNSRHYKSGVNEALIYHACGFTIGGLGGITDFNTHFLFVVGILVLSYAAIRYLDLITSALAMACIAGFIFYELYSLGDFMQFIIPFAFLLIFTPAYFLITSWRKRKNLELWHDNLLVAEVFSLLLIYLAGNYLVVRELSIELLGMALEEGSDIPFAYIFYFLTVLIPVLYLTFGIVKKDVVLLRTCLLTIAFTVFTFRYYQGMEQIEFFLTAIGCVLLAITLALFNYLKVIRRGFTRENLLSEKWTSMNAEAFIISQTMGGNEVTVEQSFQGKGGSFGGGGSSGDF